MHRPSYHRERISGSQFERGHRDPKSGLIMNKWKLLIITLPQIQQFVAQHVVSSYIHWATADLLIRIFISIIGFYKPIDITDFKEIYPVCVDYINDSSSSVELSYSM
jgi:hypothetical protein